MPSNDSAATDRPNIVLITCHDLGQHIGCYGVDTVETPTLDRLAGRGVRFENATASSPVCSPSRGSMLTGQYPQTNGLMGLTHSPWWWELDDGAVAMPELLADAGFDTHLIGFQHVADDPHRLGFQHQHSEDLLAEETISAAADVFENAGEEPFYAQIGFHDVHRAERPIDREPYDANGIQVPGHLKPTEEIREDLAIYQAHINALDEHVGAVLDALEASGRRENTIVAFVTDHGIPYPGAKWWCRAAGVQIALMMDGPGAAFEEHDTVTTPFSNVDLLPTVLGIAGVPVPDRVEGVNWRDYLSGDMDDPPREAALTQFTAAGNEQRGVLTADHTLVYNFGAGREIEYPVAASPSARAGPNTGDPRPIVQLYDREDDPDELTNVAPDRDQATDDLVGRLRQWLVDVDDPLLRGGVRYPYNERALRDLLTS